MISYLQLAEHVIPRTVSNQARKNWKNKNEAYIYMLIVNKRIVYIGKVVGHFFNRVCLHRSKMKFDEFIIVDFFNQDEFDDIDDMEQYYIWKYNPILNNGFTTYEAKVQTDWERSF